VEAHRWPVWALPANLLTWFRLLLIPVVIQSVRAHHYPFALVLVVAAGASDGADGWVARRWRQTSRLGLYLDPIVDKLLLSTLFVLVAAAHALPWVITILVFTRDACILTTTLTLYLSTGFRDFRPSLLGKANTVAEVVTVGLALLQLVVPDHGVAIWKHAALPVVFVLTYASGLHYAFTCAERYRTQAEMPISVA